MAHGHTSVMSRPFTPLSLSPVLWLDASDSSTITASSGAVSQWNDKSGNGNNVTQSTGTQQPITGTRTINSLNVLDFDGTNDFLTAGDKFDLLTGGITIAVVAAIDVTGKDMFMVGKSPNGGGPGRYRFYPQLTTLESIAVIQDTAFRGASSSFTATTPTIHAMRCQRDTTNGLSLYRNGATVAQTTTVGTTSYNISDPFIIGSLAGVAEYFNGVIGELVVVQSALSDTALTNLHNYLNAKWAVY